MKRKAVIFTSILSLAILVGYRIQRIRAEEELRVNNIVRIHSERGAPHDYVVAKKSSGVLLEPLFVQNGGARWLRRHASAGSRSATRFRARTP